MENRHLEDGLSRRDEHIDDLISQIRRYDEVSLLLVYLN